MRRIQQMLMTGMFLVGWKVAAAAQEERPQEISLEDFKRPKKIEGTRDVNIEGGSSVFVFKKPGGAGNKMPKRTASDSAVTAKLNRPIFRLRRTKPRPKPVPAEAGPTIDKSTSDQKPKTLNNQGAATVWEQLGVTFWRLRPAKATDDPNATLPVYLPNGLTEQWVPERVSATTEFRLGDRVRLSVEAPRGGYLYIIDREMYADGTLGEAKMIFPTKTTRGGNNRVSPGIVVDLPSQTDHIPFFTLKSNDVRYRGELLTIIVSPQPIRELPVSDGPLDVSNELITSLEETYGTEADEYEQEAGVGKAYTRTEKEAGCEPNKLIMQKGGCTQSRQLTQDDPLPQTVYRVRVRPGEALLLNLSLSAR